MLSKVAKHIIKATELAPLGSKIYEPSNWIQQHQTKPRPTKPNQLKLTRGDTDKVVEIKHSSIKATDLTSLGVVVYDPGYMNTAMCTSRITLIDGDKGVLRYRGYPIEQLAEHSSFLEVAYLLMNGELPNKSQLAEFSIRIMAQQKAVPSNVTSLIHTFRPESHCMAAMVSALAALGATYPDANPALKGPKVYNNPSVREAQIFRLLGSFPVMAAHFLLHRSGISPSSYLPHRLDPSDPLSYTEYFLAMLGLGKTSPLDARPHPKVVKALDTLLIIHADHEINCSTAAVRHLTTSGVDVFTAVSGATGALYGPSHGGATEAALRMLERIDSVENIPAFLQGVKDKKERLVGFGHRIYKNYDPRAKMVRKIADDIFQVYGSDPLINLATALEKAARNDEYFVSRKLYPNIDFYSGVIYKAIGFPTDFFPCLFAMGRMSGWLAHWVELLQDPEMKIVRPRQVYKGPSQRHYLTMQQRQRLEADNNACSQEASAVGGM